MIDLFKEPKKAFQKGQTLWGEYLVADWVAHLTRELLEARWISISFWTHKSYMNPTAVEGKKKKKTF